MLCVELQPRINTITLAHAVDSSVCVLNDMISRTISLLLDDILSTRLRSNVIALLNSTKFFHRFIPISDSNSLIDGLPLGLA